MKIYIASKTKHAGHWLKLRVMKPDHTFTSTWIDEACEGQTRDYSELATRCLADVAQSDYLLLYCAAGEILKGALIEVGAALALGKEVRCVGDSGNLSRVFARHPLWRWFSSIDAALSAEMLPE